MIMNMNELKDMYNVQCKLNLIDIHVLEFCKLNLMFNFFLNQTLCLYISQLLSDIFCVRKLSIRI